MENLNKQMSNDVFEAYDNTDAAKKVGFRDGFIGVSAGNISPYIDQQNAYFKAFQEGRKHREDVEELCKKEDIGIDELMKKAFYFYRNSKYETTL